MFWLGRRSNFFLRILIVTSFVTTCKNKKDSTAPRSAPPTVVDVIIASTQTITNTVQANGTVVASEYVELHPESSGRLIYLNVPEGTKVKAGTVIARVNDADLKAQLEKAKVQLELAQKTESRYRQLLAVNGINQSDYDVALNAVNSYRADINYNKALLEKTVLKAPFNGVLGLRQVSLGAYVSPNTLIATIQQLDHIKIDFTLPEQFGNVLKKGSTVDIEVDAATQTHQKATISAVEPQVNQATRNLKVRAILLRGKANPGSFVKVTLNASVDKKAIMVPTNSIIPDDKNNQLIVVRDGRAVFVNIESGMREANNVEITKGLNVGDTVVVTGVLFARPKNEVHIRSVKTIQQLTLASNAPPE